MSAINDKSYNGGLSPSSYPSFSFEESGTPDENMISGRKEDAFNFGEKITGCKGSPLLFEKREKDELWTGNTFDNLYNKKGSKEIAEGIEKGTIKLVHVEDSNSAQKQGRKRKVFGSEEIQEDLERNGFIVVDRNGKETVHSPNDFEFTAWNPEQIAEINRLAISAFQALDQSLKGDEEKNKLRQEKFDNRDISPLERNKTPINKEKFSILGRLMKENAKNRIRQEIRLDELAKEEEHKREKARRKAEGIYDNRMQTYKKRDEWKELKKQEDIKLDNLKKSSSH